MIRIKKQCRMILVFFLNNFIFDTITTIFLRQLKYISNNSIYHIPNTIYHITYIYPHFYERSFVPLGRYGWTGPLRDP